jgi:hypothetical protein
MQTTHYGAHGNFEHFSDLFVVKSFDIGQQNGQPEGFGQGINGGLHLGIGEGFQRNVFCRSMGFNRFQPPNSSIEEEVFNFFIEV